MFCDHVYIKHFDIWTNLLSNLVDLFVTHLWRCWKKCGHQMVCQISFHIERELHAINDKRRNKSVCYLLLLHFSCESSACESGHRSVIFVISLDDFAYVNKRVLFSVLQRHGFYGRFLCNCKLSHKVIHSHKASFNFSLIPLQWSSNFKTLWLHRKAANLI